MNTLKLILFILTFMGVIISAHSQTIINYNTWTGASGCNVFSDPNNSSNPVNVPCVINGSNSSIAHLTAIGQPTYDNTNKTVNLVSEINGSLNYGTEYRITVGFKQAYSYKITITAARIMSSQSGPNVLLRTDLNNGGSGSNNQCNGTGTIDANGSGNLKLSLQVTNSSFSTSDTNYVFDYVSLSAAQNYLMIAAIPPAGSVYQTILIRRIKVEEFPPTATFTLSPSSHSVTCGFSTAQTFTVTNVYSTPNVTNYSWNLGSSNNGWLHNGNPAGQTISTGTTNTLTLTPVCGASLSNSIGVTVTAGGNNYQTNTAAISLTNPTLSINGSNNFCTGTSNYSINNLPCNASVSWSASPSGVVSLSCTSCTSTTLTRVADGIVTLTATITKTNACSSGTETKDLTITVGAPKIYYGGTGVEAFNLTAQNFSYGPGNSFSVCPSEFLVFSPYFPSGYTPPNITAHQWTISGSYTSTGSLTQSSFNVITASPTNASFSFTYQYQNACGWSPLYYGGAGNMDCANGEEPYRGQPDRTSSQIPLTVFPNPVDKAVTIPISITDVGKSIIRLYNSSGQEVKKILATSQLTNINMTGMTKGVYFIQVSNGQKIITYKIIKR
jgi:hypothetical protein